MTTVELYQPGKINASISFPTSWNELLLTELRHISTMLLAELPSAQATRAAIFTGMLYWRAKSEKVKLPKDLMQHLNTEDAVISGFPLLDFLFEGNDLTIQPFPVINLYGGLLKLKGPADHFNSLTCGEFEDTEIFYHRFREDPTKESLASLAAVLWRPFNKPYIRIKAGKRKEYKYARLLPILKKQPVWKLYSIFCWYQGCREQLPKLFPTVFADAGESKGSDPLSFTKCIHAGAGPKNGSRDQIRLLKLLEFFFDMEQDAIKAKEMNKMIENARK